MKIIKYIFVLFLICTSFIISQSKQGGVCFRVDDNGRSDLYTSYKNLFDTYGFKFCFALNFENYPFADSSAYTTTLKAVQDDGHELMDHTPSHSTSYFNTIFTVTDYDPVDHPDAIDHRNGTKVCLKYITPSYPGASVRNGTVNTSGYTLTRTDSASFSTIHFRSSENFFIYLPSLDKLIIVTSNDGVDPAIVTDAWGDDIDLGVHPNISFYCYHDWDIQMTQAALQLLATETQLARAHYGFTSNPTTWIQPGGYWPMITRADAQNAFTSKGYSNAATYPNESYKVFNETGTYKRWSMQWGNFSEASSDIDALKTTIADGIAKHKVLIGNLHFDDVVGSWASFKAKMNTLLSWCHDNSIPVKTYSQWANTLYGTTPDASQNIFPSIDADLNGNNLPDGYSTDYAIGTFASSGGAPGFSGCYSISTAGLICWVQDLGGVEKGSNDFEIWTKGPTDGHVSIAFSWGDGDKGGSGLIDYRTVNASTSEWTKYTLTGISIPSGLSMLNVEFSSSYDASAGEIKISGMRMAPTGALPVELTSFTALTKKDGIELNWKTATEVDNFGFDVERKTNDAWQKIGFVKGNGNSNSPKSYSFNDNLIAPDNTVQYRLKQIDTDGKYKYSDVVEVSAVPAEFKLCQNYPNPFNPSTNIKYSLAADSKVKLEVFNIIGEKVDELVNNFQPSGNYTVEFNGSKLASGTYIYRLQAGNFTQVKKLVLMK